MRHREVFGEPDVELRTEPDSELPGRPAGHSSVGGGSGSGGI